jgi:hypothetical protein
MMAFVLKGIDGDLFTLFHGVSVDLVLWHSSSCSMDLSTMHELCFPCARLMKFMYLFSLRVSSSQDFLVWLLKVFPIGVSPLKIYNVYTSSF